MLPCGSIKLELPVASTPYSGPAHSHDISDDNIVFINKPDKRVADIILENWDLNDPELVRKTLFVGDSLDDMVCGKNAGCLTCFMITEENEMVSEDPKYQHLMNYKIRHLHELIQIINN
jgi:phosphoglycolate phosphatase-like HAD superfamily hydrolase